MKFLLACLSVLLVVSFVDARIYGTVNGSVNVNDTSLELAKSDFPHLLVNFDKGCKWCLAFRPYYSQARLDAKADKWNVTFGWLNLKNNPASAAKYNITHHPTQLLFIKNYPKSPIKYYGTKNARDLKTWLKTQLDKVKALGY